MGKGLEAWTIAVMGIMIAVVATFTLVIRVPIAATGGYINLSDVAIFFAAFTFGPWVGLIAGGVGTGLADIVGGYPQFAWLSLLAHGLQGLVAGYIAHAAGLPRMVLGAVVGAVIMVGGYFLGEALVMVGMGPALAEVPANIIQVVVGAVVGIALVLAVRQAYPPVVRLGRPESWKEL